MIFVRCLSFCSFFFEGDMSFFSSLTPTDEGLSSGGDSIFCSILMSDVAFPVAFASSSSRL